MNLAADVPLVVTFFDDVTARAKLERTISLGELAEMIRTTTKPEKSALPSLKLARFGDLRSPKGALRHDANVIACTGVEADYDGGKIGCEQAIEIAEKARLGCIIHTSPSYTPEKPRWRILCPADTEIAPTRRAYWVSCLNGLFGGIFAAESWTLSQAFFYGSIAGNPRHSVHLVEGVFIDHLDELAEIAIGKPATSPPGVGTAAATNSQTLDEEQLLDAIRTGAEFHSAAIRLLGAWAFQGIPIREADRRLREAFNSVLPPDRDRRWHDRVREIPKLLEYVYVKQTKKRDAHAERNAKEFAEFEARLPPEDDGDEYHHHSTSWASPAPQTAHEPWPELAPAAYYGLAGRIVETISPHSEADPAALLLQFLVMAGNAIGRVLHYRHENDRHGTNLYLVLVGPTSRGRKGVAAGRIRNVMEGADSDWANCRIVSGLSSGEGLIWAVRDPITGPINVGKGKNARHVEDVIDPGVEDKRLLVFEPEFARALAVMKRDGNTLSAVVREAWDGRPLSILTKNSPARASGAHISIIAHITADELRAELDRISLANGLANRFLFACTRRSKLLPFGGNLANNDVLTLAWETHEALEAARGARRRIDFAAATRAIWDEAYRNNLSVERPGILGAVTARAEAQTIRLANLYAMLDGCVAYDPPHLDAALAVWNYCTASAAFVFGDSLGDPLADEILRALRQAGTEGLTRNQIAELFGGHRRSDRIGAALALLLKYNKARWTRRPSRGGRPPEVWVAV
jgi:hypothetical protein